MQDERGNRWRGPRCAASAETACGIASAPAEPAPTACWPGTAATGRSRTANHCRRDATFGEDVSRIRARHAPANNATLNNIALAVVFHRGFRYAPERTATS